MQLKHSPMAPTGAVVGPAIGNKKSKFPRPEIDQVQTLEVWDTFIADWEEYKRQRGVSASNAPGLLVAFCSPELKTNLHRITGGKHYTKPEAYLMEEIKKLMVKHQNPAVHVEEFLSMRQEDEEDLGSRGSLTGVSSQ